MNYLKRMFCSIKRCKFKTLLFFLSVFLLGNFISASIAINQATDSIKSDIRTELGATIVLSAGEEVVDTYLDFLLEGNFQDEEHFEYDKSIIEVFNRFEENENVSYMDSVIYTAIYSKDIRESLIEENDSREFEPLKMYSLIGENEADFKELRENKIILVSGRTFTEEEMASGEKVIIISDEFNHITSHCASITDVKDDYGEVYKYVCQHEGESLEVGDTVRFTRKISLLDDLTETIEEEVEYEIIGIYKNIDEFDKIGFEVRDQSLVNNIYTPYKTVENEVKEYISFVKDFKEEHPEEEYFEDLSYYGIKSLSMKLSEPEEVEYLAEEMNKAYEQQGIKGIIVNASSDTYNAVAGPLESLSTIAKMILFLSLVVSFIILSLIVSLFLKDRRKEIGLYSALGEKKWKILLQLILEVYLVGILAISLSLFTGSKLGEAMSQEILKTQIEKNREITEEKLAQLDIVNENLIDLNTIEKEYKIEINAEYIVGIYVTGTLVLIISGFLPIWNTLRKDPKKILM